MSNSELLWECIGIPLVGGILLYWVQTAMIKAPGDSLRNKFVSLGDMSGKTQSEIVGVCGGFNSISYLQNGNYLCIWSRTGYMISIIFDSENRFKGISSEISV